MLQLQIIENHPQYVLIKFAGAGHAKNFEMYFVPLVMRCQQANVQRCLCDVTAAEFTFSSLNRGGLSRSSQIIGGYGIKLAMLTLDTQQLILERMLLGAGQPISLFNERETALAWLLAV